MITIERQGARDDWGERTGWASAGTFRVNAVINASAEANASEGVETRTRYTFRLRNTPAAAGISAADRITFRGTTVDIAGITPNERGTELEIAGVAHG